MIERESSIRAVGRPMTLGEIGEVLGVSRERVRQIEQSALRKLRLRYPEALKGSVLNLR